MRQQGSHYYRRDSRIRAFAGRLRVTRVSRLAIDGTRRSVPVYAIDVGRNVG